MASFRVRNEEFTTLGDFIKASFEKDLAAIGARYPKLNQSYYNAFSAKLEQVKQLESVEVVTADQKKATRSLELEAAQLNKELNFLSDYFSDAGIDPAPVSKLKTDLSDGNIEGAVAKVESVVQLIGANKTALVEEGMQADFDETLAAHKVSLSTKNALQNKHMNNRKAVTSSNEDQYAELYAYISKIADAGKRVFDDTVTEDQYTISKIIKRMRAAKREDDEDNAGS